MIRVAAISINTGSDKAKNVDRAFTAMDEAISHGANWLSLPEVWTGFAKTTPPESFRGELWSRLKEFAQQKKVFLCGGSFAEKQLGGEVKNTSYVFSPEGEELGRYEKIHLFRLARGDGSYEIDEGRSYSRGDAICNFMYGDLNVGMSICYDLRFSELYRKLSSSRPLDVIFVPSAFTKTTGLAHWHLLVRARAIEFQSFVIAANQAGQHPNQQESFGHSLIVDPWGRILADSGPNPGIAISDIDLEEIAKVRSKLGVFEHRCLH